MLCKVMNYSPLSNLYRKVGLNVQKSVRVVVPWKLVKANGGKDLTGTVD
jgi:hypothetical protein